MKLIVKVQQSQGKFRAWCPALPGCRAHGESHDHARKQLEEAIRGYLASLNVAPPAMLEQQLVEV